MLDSCKVSYYLCGICGIGMSALAQLIKHLGFDVRGSDISPQKEIKEILNSQGIEVFSGHDGKRLKENDIVIISEAITEDNPELQVAKDKGLKVMHRVQAMKFFLEGKKTIAITGTHGKTSTTYIIAGVLRRIMGEKAGMILGGIAVDFETNFLPGEELYVIELDESDGSFVSFQPDIKVITNIDCDHLENYQGDFHFLKQNFEQFLSQGGINVVSDECKDIFDFSRYDVLYGVDSNCNYRGEIIKKNEWGSNIYLYKDGNRVLEYKFPIIGYKLAVNSLSVFAVGEILGWDLETIGKQVSKLKGVKRRYEFKYQSSQIKVIEDYAHHPREINEVITTIRDYLNPGRLIVVFQPHRYTRTKYLWEDFKTCFAGSDILLLTDIYPAFESLISGIDSSRLAEEVKNVNCMYVRKEDILPVLLSIWKEGDIILILGAGDINKVSDIIVEGIKNARS